MRRLVIYLQKAHIKNLQKSNREVLEQDCRLLTQVFLGGLAALNKEGRTGTISKSSSTLQHVLN
jgi:hypothetical protein